jgi:N-methylhydantoinase A
MTRASRKRSLQTSTKQRSGPSGIAPLRIAIDTGGTFTDCLCVVGGEVRMLKAFSTPADPSRAIVEALRKLAGDTPVLALHGTTVGTNTLLERKGARVAFVTTAGFEDSIEIGRQARPRLYDLFFDRIPPLVDADCRFGVNERTSPEGKVRQVAGAAALRELAIAVGTSKAEAIAVSLLFSFANPANERAVATALEALGVPLSISHIILPEFREYERASTVVVNAYLQPVMQRYLENLDRRLAELSPGAGGKSGVFVMQSSGGITSLASAAREPVRTVLSGPAGGVVGAAAMARRSGFDRIISFDMGGTSTDVALVGGELRASSEAEVAGLPVRVPMLDIHTVGAGGGSLARFDAAGALRVGPESAGADPGPICYGRGALPTVTDANLLLGRLQPGRFLGGDFTLDLERTRRVVQEWLRQNKSRITLERFAAGVVRVVNATMEKAIRVVSIERGYDPREFALVAFGGAGGMHACELAQTLGIPRVIVPLYPGALSAFGILVSDVVKDYSRTVLWRIVVNGMSRDIRKQLATVFAELEQQARRDLARERWRGAVKVQQSVDIRYSGQGYELNVAFDRRTAVSGLIRKFHAEHQRRYGYSHAEREVEMVTLRLRARMASPALPRTKLASGKPKGRPVTAPVSFSGGRSLPAAIWDRDDLQRSRRYRGPAIVTEYSATTVIPPGMGFHVDAAGNLIIAVR